MSHSQNTSLPHPSDPAPVPDADDAVVLVRPWSLVWAVRSWFVVLIASVVATAIGPALGGASGAAFAQFTYTRVVDGVEVIEQGYVPMIYWINMAIAVVVAALLLVLVLVLVLGDGRNWARIVLTVIAVLTLLAVPFEMLETLSDGIVQLLLQVVSTVALIVALVQMWLPDTTGFIDRVRHQRRTMVA